MHSHFIFNPDVFVQNCFNSCLCLFLQQLPPHVRVWDSVTLNTLHVIGMGFFDRAVTCIAFSKSVSRVK